ncbi:tpiA [Symbiodinium microadriaticum]|nr:tpiA [Symbiodinium microadriaticum]
MEVPYTLIGHSERRSKYGESDEDTAVKVEKCQAAGIKVIFCIGELLEEREAGKTDEAVCVLPRMIIACALCVMGCRWLTATDNLQEILVNGVALEFVISLESILYAVVVSGRNKLMVDPELQLDAVLRFLC